VTAGVALSMHLHWIHSDLPAGSVFRNHIMTGHMMSFAAYLAGKFAWENRKWRWIYVGALVMFTYEILYISQGRTGYIIYFVLMTLLILQTFSWRICAGLMVFLILFGAFTVQYSPILQHRYQRTLHEISLAKAGHHKTSVGYRVQFQHLAYSMLKEKLFLGHGTGAYTDYADHNPIPGWHKKLREPHNQYWLIAAEYGLLGVLIYFWFLGGLLMASVRLSRMKPIAFAVLIPFIIGSFSDSLLFYSGCGYFFLVMMALCLGEKNNIIE
ncbi:MAG TPA: O-antigen ligase family protein, partial [Legionellaceae bacterium]|nr:O-antigen ligase family protein [Legionellaceae bacterium]